MRGKTLKASPLGEAQRVEKPPSAREVPRRGGGREPCHSPKYFGQPHSSLPHRLRAEPPHRGGQGVSTPFRQPRLPPWGKLSAKRTDEGRTYGSYPAMGGHGSFPLIRPRAGPRPPSPLGEGSCKITSCWAPARPCRPCRGAGPRGWSRCRRPAGGSPGRRSAYAAEPRRCCSACGPAGSCRSHP